MHCIHYIWRNCKVFPAAGCCPHSSWSENTRPELNWLTDALCSTACITEDGPKEHSVSSESKRTPLTIIVFDHGFSPPHVCDMWSALTVFTQASVVTWSTPTRPRHSVTRAVVLTVALQCAVGPKPTRWTLWERTHNSASSLFVQPWPYSRPHAGIPAFTCVAVFTGPSQSAGAVAGGRVTHSSVAAVTEAGTVRPEPACRAAWGQTHTPH